MATDADAHLAAGDRLYRAGRPDAAAARFRQAIAADIRCLAAYRWLANALECQGQWREAAAALRQAVRVAPEDALSHVVLGLALLRQGDFAAGWPEWQWRLKLDAVAAFRARLGQPDWDGRPLDGGGLVLFQEQGLGDTI